MCVLFFVCLCILLHRRPCYNHCVLASSCLLTCKTWLLLINSFFFVSLFNTYYLLSNENPLFVILSLVACVLLFFLQNSTVFLSRYFIVHLLCLFFLSLFDIFDLCPHFFHIHLFHFTYFYVYSVICCWFTCFIFKIVHHRLLLLYLQKYSLTLIIESSRFLMSRLHGCSRYLAPYKLVFITSFFINDDRFLGGV